MLARYKPTECTRKYFNVSFEESGTKVRLIHDSPGFRIYAHMACNAENKRKSYGIKCAWCLRQAQSFHFDDIFIFEWTRVQCRTSRCHPDLSTVRHEIFISTHLPPKLIFLFTFYNSALRMHPVSFTYFIYFICTYTTDRKFSDITCTLIYKIYWFSFT